MIRAALRSWTAVWQATPESSLDPRNEHGPIPFTTSSLLGMAYVLLHLNMGPNRQFETRDPDVIAASILELPPVTRSPRLTSALLYSCHSLSIPVRLGVDYVSRTQAFFWSIRHCLSSFECAVLLSKWLLLLKNTWERNPPTGRFYFPVHFLRKTLLRNIIIPESQKLMISARN
jgi:hypothetical protein